MNHPLVDMASEGDPVGGLALGDELDLLRGKVGDPAVQGQVHRGLLAHVVDESVGPRMAVPFHAAAAEPLVEALQPTQAASAVQVDEAWDARPP